MASAAIASDSAAAFARLGGSPAVRVTAIVVGLLALGAFWGAAVAMAGVSAVLICASLIACVFVLRDFRSGVVLLILVMPISASFLFPHSMLMILHPFVVTFSKVLTFLQEKQQETAWVV